MAKQNNPTSKEKTKKGEPAIITQTRGEFDTDSRNWTDREFSHPERTIRVATSFSGIGGPEKGLERLGLKTKIVFACDIGERYLKYTYKQLKDFIKDFSDEDKEKFIQALWNANHEEKDADEKRILKKELEKEGFFFDESELKIKGLKIEDIRDNLLGVIKDSDTLLQLTTESAEIIFKHHNITTQEEKEKYIDRLYDEKGVNWVKESFFANHDIDESAWHTDIFYLDGTKYKGEVDVYIGGSPCQAFAQCGKRLGLSDLRGGLFKQFARIVDEVKPKVFIFENVKGMKSKPKEEGKISGLQGALEVFDNLGYKVYWQILDAKEYGIPQHRERIWVVAFRNDIAPDDFKYPAPIPLTTRMYDYLDEDKPPRNGKVETPYIRHLTGTECLRLMGFTDFKVAPRIEEEGKKLPLKKDRILREQAGNSMVVECLMALYKQMDITQYGEELD